MLKLKNVKKAVKEGLSLWTQKSMTKVILMDIYAPGNAQLIEFFWKNQIDSLTVQVKTFIIGVWLELSSVLTLGGGVKLQITNSV